MKWLLVIILITPDGQLHDGDLLRHGFLQFETEQACRQAKSIMPSELRTEHDNGRARVSGLFARINPFCVKIRPTASEEEP